MNRLLLGGVVALVLVGLVAGFSVVGGPGYARSERHDRTRLADLDALMAYQVCALNLQKAEGAAQKCALVAPDPGWADPVTGEAYVFAPLESDSFEVCATFETQLFKAERYRARKLRFDGQKGCLRFAGGGRDGT